MTEACGKPGPMRLTCTQPDGHEGPHVAATVSGHINHIHAIWTDEAPR